MIQRQDPAEIFDVVLIVKVYVIVDWDVYELAFLIATLNDARVAPVKTKRLEEAV